MKQKLGLQPFFGADFDSGRQYNAGMGISRLHNGASGLKGHYKRRSFNRERLII